MSFGRLNKKLAGVAFAALLGTFAVGTGASDTVAASVSNFSSTSQAGSSSTVKPAATNNQVAGKKKRKKRRKKRRRRGSYHS